MIEKQHKKKQKSSKIHRWQFQGRTLTIERFHHAPKTIHFVGGAYVPVVKDQYSLKAVSRHQKQMRQELYRWLEENGLNTEHYILNIDAPLRVSNNRVFLELVIMFEPATNMNESMQESICQHFFELLANSHHK